MSKQTAAPAPEAQEGSREEALSLAKAVGLIDWISDDGKYFHFACDPEESSEKLVAFAAACRATPQAQAAGQELPPLPSPAYFETTYRVVGFGDGTLFADRPGDLVPNGRKAVAYTAEQMRDYARAALAKCQPSADKRQ